MFIEIRQSLENPNYHWVSFGLGGRAMTLDEIEDLAAELKFVFCETNGSSTAIKGAIMTKHSNVIDEKLLNALQKIEIFPSGINYKPGVEAARALLATELVRMMETVSEELREDILKILHKTESCTGCKDHYKPPHKCDMDLAAPRCAKRVKAIEKLARTRLTAIIERELG